MPIVKTIQKIKELKAGQVLEVLADDKGIKQDMHARCQTTGNECLGHRREQRRNQSLREKKAEAVIWAVGK